MKWGAGTHGAADRARGASQRQLRAAELMRHALIETLTREELREPALAGVSITVSEVRMSPDLRHATCFVLPLGGADVAGLAEIHIAKQRNGPIGKIDLYWKGEFTRFEDRVAERHSGFDDYNNATVDAGSRSF